MIRIEKIFVLVVILLALPVLISNTVDAVSSCYNASASPIPICNCDDLNLTRDDLTADYQLQNNIDCINTSIGGHALNNGGLGFAPIGHDLSNRFSGTFYGNGKNITNLYINRNSTNYVGLFGVLTTNSNITDLGLVNVNINGSDYVGGLAGRTIQGSIFNSFVIGNISGTDYVGGLVGYFGDRTINASYSSGNVIGYGTNGAQIGGLVGYASTSDTLTINHSYSTSTVTGKQDVGGLIGEVQSTTGDTMLVYDSYATGNVTNSGSYSGGLVGTINAWPQASPTFVVVFNKTYATGNVTGSANYIGGLMGWIRYKLLVVNSYATGSVTGISGADNVGGLVGGIESTYPKINKSFSTGAVSGDSNVGGLVGLGTSSCQNSFWDNETSGQSSSGCGGDTGKSTAEMKLVTTFTDTDTIGLTHPWDFLSNPNDDIGNLNIWNIDGSTNNGYPFFVEQTSVSVTISSPTNGSNTTDRNLNITYLASATEGIDSCWYSNNSGVTNSTLSGCTNITNVTWNVGLNNITIYANDTLGNQASAIVTFTRLEDDDMDSIADNVDNLLYNESNVIKSGITNLNITIDNNRTYGSYNNSREVIFYDDGVMLLNFTHNFSSSKLDLSNISITKSSNSLVINLSGQLQGNKTIYISDNSFTSLCVKDQEIASVSEISTGCDGSNETDFTSCLGGNATISGIVCIDQGSTIRLDNLQNSGVRGNSPSSNSNGGGSASNSKIGIELDNLCAGEEVNVLIESLGKNYFVNAEASIYRGEEIDNSKLVYRFIMQDNNKKFVESLSNNFVLNETGEYIISIKSSGFIDLEHKFNIASCKSSNKHLIEEQYDKDKEQASVGNNVEIKNNINLESGKDSEIDNYDAVDSNKHKKIDEVSGIKIFLFTLLIILLLLCSYLIYRYPNKTFVQAIKMEKDRLLKIWKN